jgi:hypothetical protein
MTACISERTWIWMWRCMCIICLPVWHLLHITTRLMRPTVVELFMGSSYRRWFRVILVLGLINVLVCVGFVRLSGRRDGHLTFQLLLNIGVSAQETSCKAEHKSLPWDGRNADSGDLTEPVTVISDPCRSRWPGNGSVLGNCHFGCWVTTYLLGHCSQC